MNGLLEAILDTLRRYPKVLILVIGLLAGGAIARNVLAVNAYGDRITKLEGDLAVAKGGAAESSAGREILAQIAALRQRFEEESKRANERLDRIERMLDQQRRNGR